MLAAAFLLILGCNNTSSRQPGPVLTGGIATVDSLLSANRGRWVLVNLWATWCRPCVAETPDLVAFAHSTSDAPLAMIAISADYFVADDTTAVRKVRAFQSQQAIPYPNLVFIGTPDDLTARFEAGGVLPTTLLIDPQGNTVRQTIGILTSADFDTLRALVGD